MTVRDKFFTHIAQTSDHPMGLEVASADGCYITTTDGKKFVDLISGIAVSSLGHRHPSVIQAIHDQLDRHLHVMVYGEFIQRPQSEFASLLCSLLPESLSRVYFVNSGTEAVEGALKLAKKYTGRSEFLSFENSYHGDTHGSLSVTGRNVYKDPFRPLLPDIRFGHFNDPGAIALIGNQTAAVILEPIQGEGGIVPADADWLNSIRQACDEAGALLIFDEIQTGFFRLGESFAFRHYGVIPDILCLAKAMGGGMPLGAFVASDEILSVFRKDPPLSHVTTFGGHPVSCAAAFANLKELIEGNYGNRAREIEKTARRILKGSWIQEVRGVGAMLGIQLDSRKHAREVVLKCFKKGLILGWTLHSDTLIRLAPPLIISDKLLTESLETIMKSMDS